MMNPKPKRSFVDTWLNDNRYKHWIRKVSSDNTLYYCTICDRNFSCNAAHISRHADSACHRNNLKENVSSCDEDISVEDKTPSKIIFRNEWLDLGDFKLWLREIPSDKSICFCTICDKSFAARLSHIRRHAKSKSHLTLCEKKGIQASELNDDFNTQDNESLLSFDERKKSVEIQYAALIAERNIPHQTAQEVLSFFQYVGQDPNVLKNMGMGRTKIKNIISNVLYPVENEYIVNKLQKTRFSIFIDETSDICNEKWIIFFVRYVDSETLNICSQLIKLINFDSKDSNIEKLVHAFQWEIQNLQIPFLNIIALSYDNGSVMEKALLFKTKLKEICKHILMLPCPCYSTALAAHNACVKIPSFCEDFLKKIIYYINSSSKRLTIFHEFCDCFEEKYRKILKLSEMRWLSHYTCVRRLLESWNKIRHFLQEMIANDKTISAEYLLSMMDNLEMKAYFLFLKYILYFFNIFNIFFQSVETRIHLLQLKSTKFLFQICQNFIKEEYLKNIININFSHKKIQKDIDEIFVGPECEEYLNNLMEDHIDTVITIRQNCLQFYCIAADEIRKRLFITHDSLTNFLSKLQVFGPFMSLLDDNRETSFQHVSFIARTLEESFDEESLRKEWFALSIDFTMEEKQNISKLNFDDMWKEILNIRQLPSNTYKYPNLRNILNIVRSLPNSNADPERFLILSDLKSKKRNKLSSACVNATCVIKSALKMKAETAISMTITKQHLSRMLSDKLYAIPKKKKKRNLHAADEIVGSLSTI